MDLNALLELQAIDTHLSQLAHKRETLPEKIALASLDSQIVHHEQVVAKVEAALVELAAGLTEAENRGNDCDGKRKKLETQLRTVIAPREAESLQREIATLNQEREEADSIGLDLMEQIGEQETARDRLQGELADLIAKRPELVAAFNSADSEFVGEIERENQRRSSAAAALGEDVARYEVQRKHLGGIAVASLVGRSCSGCHLDLSAGELQQLKDLSEGSDPECPNCGRWLVL